MTSVAGTTAMLLLAGILAGTGASAAEQQHSPAASMNHLAYDLVTGKMVTVGKSDIPTPVHPEQVTHPQQDLMGVSAEQASQSLGAAAAPARNARAADPPRLPGIDVSDHNHTINWALVAPHLDFAYAKATEGIHYHNSLFTNQYEGMYNRGKIRGAYHFALPNVSSGAAQANYFAHHGGGWSRDGRTLPGALDIEYNPYGRECYGLSKHQMTGWIWDFVNQYARDTGVYPVIYTTFAWWRTCTGNANGFQSYDPLWIACYCKSPGALPAGYHFYTFWQYANHGKLPGDQDVFDGAYSRLRALALG